jgi:hypothetical protein
MSGRDLAELDEVGAAGVEAHQSAGATRTAPASAGTRASSTAISEDQGAQLRGRDVTQSD